MPSKDVYGKDIHKRLLSKSGGFLDDMLRGLVEKSLEGLGEKHPPETEEIIARFYKEIK